MTSPCGWVLYNSEDKPIDETDINPLHSMDELKCFSYRNLWASEQQFKIQAVSIFTRLKRLNCTGFNVRIKDTLYRVKAYALIDSKGKMPTGLLLTFFSTTRGQQALLFSASEARRLVGDVSILCPPALKSRTREIIKLTAMGLGAQEIADALSLSSRGVDYHLDIAKKNFGAANKANLVFLATKAGWI